MASDSNKVYPQPEVVTGDDLPGQPTFSPPQHVPAQPPMYGGPPNPHGQYPQYGQHPMYGGPAYGGPMTGPPIAQPAQPAQNISMTANPTMTNSTNVVVNVAGLGGPTGWRATQNKRDWSSGFCGCCEHCHSCCLAYWCFPCFLCCLATKLDENCCGPHWMPFTFMTAMRTKTRSMLGISGSICCDACAVYYCPCCAMTQIWRELEAVGA